MAELKTKENKKSVSAFLKTIKDEQKRKDSEKLVKIFTTVTKEKPTMWGSSIIGFGKYYYESKRSTQKGEWPLVGFSPRKQNISLYIMPGFKDYQDLLKNIGDHKISTGCCLYLKKLEDIHLPTLKKLIKRSYNDMKKKKHC